MCLNCKKDEVCNKEKNWELCFECYDKIWGKKSSLESVIEFQNLYWKKYTKYGEPKCKGVPLCLWYSVRPPDGTDEYKFAERIHKFISTTSIKRAIYAFEWKYQEQGGTLDSRYGMHCHMLIVGTVQRVNAHIKRQTEGYWLLNPEKQKFWIYPKDSYLVADKKKYFVDGKTDCPIKDKEKAFDKIVRKTLGFEQVYFKECDIGTLCDLSSSLNHTC